jgi:hypothetical protein
VAHMVIFQGTDGAPGYHQCESLDDAVKYVEELRNDRGIERARIFRMDEIDFEFRPYWFVVQRTQPAGSPAAERSASGSADAGPSYAEQTPSYAEQTPSYAQPAPVPPPPAAAEVPPSMPPGEGFGEQADPTDTAIFGTPPPPPGGSRGLFGR